SAGEKNDVQRKQRNAIWPHGSQRNDDNRLTRREKQIPRFARDGTFLLRLAKFGKKGFHFRTSVGVPFAGGDGDAGVEDGAGFVDAGLFDKELRVHEIAGNVFDVALEELAEMQIGTGGVSRIGTLESKAIASESVVWFLSDELFEQLAARFLLFSHGSVRIIA